MAITNGYCTLAELKTYSGISGTGQDQNLANAVDASSREIDALCSRIFYQTSSEDRYYTPIFNDEVQVDDVSTATGLVVKLDTTNDGTHNKTLTINTDFVLTPFNNVDTPEQPSPFTGIQILTTRSNERFLTSIIKQIKVTALFGYTSVPHAIKQACLLQGLRLFKRKDSPFSTYGNPETGVGELFSKFDPDALKLIKAYIKRRL